MTDTENTGAVAESELDVEALGLPPKMDLKVDIAEAGPCRKRISVVVPEAEIDIVRNGTIDEFASKASVPGFRVGRVPRNLVKAKFRSEKSQHPRRVRDIASPPSAHVCTGGAGILQWDDILLSA